MAIKLFHRWLNNRNDRQVRRIPFWILLTLIVDSIMFTSFLGFGAFSADEQSHFREIEIQNDVQNIAKSISASVINDLLAENLDNLETPLRQQIGIGSIKTISIANKHHAVILQVERSSDAKPIINYPLQNSNIISLQDSILSDSTYTVTTPITLVDQNIGWVQITADLSELTEIKRHIWVNAIIISCLTTFFTAIILNIPLRRFNRALNNVSLFALSLKDQRGNCLPESSRILELNILQHALNEASEALADQFRKLEDAEIRKGAILEASLDCLITIDAQGVIVDFNKSAEQIFGYAASEVIGKSLADAIIPLQHRAAHIQGMTHYFKTGIGPVLRKHIEITAIRSDGSEFPIELTIVPFMGSGKPYFLGSIRDISERKKLEAEQARITSLLQQTVNELELRQLALDEHAIVSIADLQGNIIYANEKLTEISGYTKEELLGHNHRILNSGLQSPAIFNELWKTISSGQVWHGELANKRKDNSIYWVTSTIVPMLDEQKKPTRYISIHTDISVNKYNEQQLAISQQHQEKLITQYQLAEHQLLQATEREMVLGQQIQRTLLFGDIPAHIGAFSIAVHTEPSKGVDGDFYEYFNFGSRYFDLSIADVMGKGVTAALFGAALKQRLNRIVSSLIVNNTTPGKLPSPEMILNKLHSRVASKLISLETFITLFYMRVDTELKQITYINAGHTRAIIAGPNGLRLLAGDNLPLGVIESEIYHQETIQLQPNDLLFLYSDGITEARNQHNEEFGEERLCNLIQSLEAAKIPAQIMIQFIRKSVFNFEEGRQQSDDRTCIALYFDGIATHRFNKSAINLPWNITALAPLRHQINEAAKQASWHEESAQSLILAGFEAATNIIRHNPKPLEDATLHSLIERLDNQLTLKIYYLGEHFDAVETTPDFSGDSEGGFGLYIIRQSVDSLVHDNPIPGICRITLTKRCNSANGVSQYD